jgi:hypothetical protein
MGAAGVRDVSRDSECAEGTLKGLDVAGQYATEEDLDRWLRRNYNEINNLGAFRKLRTKGSWVRILPAAPEINDLDPPNQVFHVTEGPLNDVPAPRPALVKGACSLAFRQETKLVLLDLLAMSLRRDHLTVPVDGFALLNATSRTDQRW